MLILEILTLLYQDNILLDTDLHVKIADFGLTRLSEATLTRSGALHPNFASPELLGCSQDDDTSDDVPARTQKSDVYAFGCLYYEVSDETCVMPLLNKNCLDSLR
jgi:serine/threonine protein kinase